MDDSRSRGRTASQSRVLGVGLGLVAILALVLGTGLADVQRPLRLPSPANPLERQRAENRELGIEIELAGRPDPYLLLDLSGPSLTLKSNGVPLRSFPVRAAQLRSVRFLGLPRREVPPVDTTWEAGTLLPVRRLERRVILSDTVSPPDKDGTVSFIPPTPQEENPDPHVFRIRFANQMSAIVRAATDGPDAADQAPEGSGPPAPAGPSPLGRLVSWLRMKPWRRDRIRLVITLPAAEAGALYRAYTDGTVLQVTAPW